MVVLAVVAFIFLGQPGPAKNVSAQTDICLNSQFCASSGPDFLQPAQRPLLRSHSKQKQTQSTKPGKQKATSNSSDKTKPAAIDSDTTELETTSVGRTHFEFPTQLVANNRHATSVNLLPSDTVTKRFLDNDTEAQQPAAPAANDSAELSKKLANPVSSLISFPIQTNFDFRMGSGSGWRMTMNVQPVIPIALNKDWNLISRTIIPIVHQGNVVAQGTSQSGLGDIVQSIFISPNKTVPFIWGAGPAILVPTATNKFLGSKQLGLGPTVVVLKQEGPWTVGILWNHIWRVAGGSGRPRVNSDFLQPFVSYATRDGWSYTFNTESTYDWTGNHWAVPIHVQVAKIVRFGKQPVSFGGALRCWVTTPSGGPEGCGPRIVITGLFPKK